jgi:hypothetical protein
MFRVIWEIESNPNFLADHALRGHIVMHLESCAKGLEKIPLAYRRIAPSARREALGMASRKAQAIRSLEVEVICSSKLEQPGLAKRMTEDMSSIALGRWFELSEVDCRRKVSMWVLVSQLVGAVGIIAVIVSILSFASKIGPAASVTFPILGAIAVGLLNKAGIPMATLSHETAADEGPKDDK